MSSHPQLRPLLQEWVSHEIAPRVADAKRLSRESNERKTRSLARRVLHALEIAAKTQGVRSDALSDELKTAEAKLRHAASLIAGGRNQSFELTDAIRGAGEEAVNRLTDKALVFWQQNPGCSYIDYAWIAKNINQFVQAEAEQLANFIQHMAEELTAALDTAAAVLSTGEREDRFTLQNFVKDMPSGEFALAPVRVRKPRTFSLSAGWARRSVRHELEMQLRESLEKFFTSYGRTLEVWIRGTLDSVAREFETHADIYRTQLQRLSGSDTTQEAAPRERVLEDVSLLREELSIEETAEASVTT